MSAPVKREMAREERIAGVLGEFETDHAILAAAARVRNHGFSRWDVHTPYPVHGMDQAMGVRATILPWIVLGGGLTGLAVAVIMQWWMNAVDYPFVVSGKPLWSIPANVPIMFELMVLFSGLTAFGTMVALNGLPRFYQPQFRCPRFKRATDDRFFVWIDHRDPRFAQAESLLREIGASHVDVVKEVLE